MSETACQAREQPRQVRAKLRAQIRESIIRVQRLPAMDPSRTHLEEEIGKLAAQLAEVEHRISIPVLRAEIINSDTP